MRKHYSFLLVTFLNLWIVKIFLLNKTVFILLILTTLAIYFKPQKLITIFLIVFLLIAQFKTTKFSSLKALSNDEQRLQTLRLNAYFPKYTRLGYYLEVKPLTISFYKIQKNFGYLVDPNLYFFASHPRSNPEIKEFEKFPYILLPFFFIGALNFYKENKKTFLITLLPPLFLLSLIGSNSLLGPFTIFPFIALSTQRGLQLIPPKYKTLSLIIFLLVFIQIIAYAIY